MSFHSAEGKYAASGTRWNTALKEREHTNPGEKESVCVCDGVEKAHV